jgi:hypothetical protein
MKQFLLEFDDRRPELEIKCKLGQLKVPKIGKIKNCC